MALVTDVKLSIERSSHTAGSICSILYNYTLICDPAEVDIGLGFSVWCELWGKDVIVDDLLGDLMNDPHTISSRPQQIVSRSFQVPCSVLNEDIGEDEIYIRVHARSSIGTTVAAVSNIVTDRF